MMPDSTTTPRTVAPDCASPSQCAAILAEGRHYVCSKCQRHNATTPPTPDALRDAALALYNAGRWSCGLSAEKEAHLWESLRDALGLDAGHATARNVHASPSAIPDEPSDIVKAAQADRDELWCWALISELKFAAPEMQAILDFCIANRDKFTKRVSALSRSSVPDEPSDNDSGCRTLARTFRLLNPEWFGAEEAEWATVWKFAKWLDTSGYTASPLPKFDDLRDGIRNGLSVEWTPAVELAAFASYLACKGALSRSSSGGTDV